MQENIWNATPSRTESNQYEGELEFQLPTVVPLFPGVEVIQADDSGVNSLCPFSGNIPVDGLSDGGKKGNTLDFLMSYRL